MIDAAFLVARFGIGGPDTAPFVEEVRDESDPLHISCHLATSSERANFRVEVSCDIFDGCDVDLLGAAVVFVPFPGDMGPPHVTILSHSLEPGTTSVKQAEACRRETVQSFVWNRYCAPQLDVNPGKPGKDPCPFCD